MIGTGYGATAVTRTFQRRWASLPALNEPRSRSTVPETSRSAVKAQAPGAPIVSISGLRKTYASGLTALQDIELHIHRGEIFALLGPNGAGKTTLINIICGIVTASAGSVVADGHDIVRDFRAARSKIG